MCYVDVGVLAGQAAGLHRPDDRAGGGDSAGKLLVPASSAEEVSGVDWAKMPARMRSAQLEEEAEEGHLDVVPMRALVIRQNLRSARIHRMAVGQSPPLVALGAGIMSRCEKGPFPVIIVVFF